MALLSHYLPVLKSGVCRTHGKMGSAATENGVFSVRETAPDCSGIRKGSGGCFMGTNGTRYDEDFYTWTQEQAALLREGAVHELDLTNLAEEIESLGKSDRRALGSHLRNLVLHLLKWQYQPGGRLPGQSWESSIQNARDEIAMILEDSPSLVPTVPELLARRYPLARQNAATETRLPLALFPATCPWTPEQVLDADFWPGEN